MLKAHGVTADILVEMLERSSIPRLTPGGYDHVDIEFDLENGWKATGYYDGDSLDYIDHFTAPDGTIICHWDWPEGDPDAEKLIWNNGK